MKYSRLLPLSFLLLAAPAVASTAEIVADTAERHARQQLQSLPGKVTITISPVDVSRLPPCSAFEAFTPPGGRLIGRTQIGVRCLGPGSYTILVSAQIAVTGTYVTTTKALRGGQIIEAGDIIVASGDIGNLPSGFVQEASTVVGKTLRNSIGAGQVLRSDQIMAALVIRQGQSVKVVSVGSGFSVTAEGKALGNGTVGQLVQVRMTSGQTVTGTARADGAVEISF